MLHIMIFYTILLLHKLLSVAWSTSTFPHSNVPELRIFENASIGTTLSNDLRVYLGLSQNSLVKLGPGSLNRFFELNNQTGRLYTIESLDLESQRICEAEKTCCRSDIDFSIKSGLSQSSEFIDLSDVIPEASLSLDKPNACKLMAFILGMTDSKAQIVPIAKLYVTVLDVNDNPPEFRNPNTLPIDLPRNGKTNVLSLSFPEGPAGIGMRYKLPRAFDADYSVRNRVKSYWLEGLDSLSRDAKFHPDQTKSINTANSEFIWSKLDAFSLVHVKTSSNLILQLDQELDREKQSEYNLRLVAEDSGGLKGFLELQIQVEDVNEYDPIFVNSLNAVTRTSYHLYHQEQFRKQYHIKESLAPGSEIGKLIAIDLDSSQGMQIRYSIESSHSNNLDIGAVFHLDPQTGILTLKSSLDYETNPIYYFTIIAIDSNPDFDYLPNSSNSQYFTNQVKSHSRTATAMVEVHVLDVNDNAPEIFFEKDYLKSDDKQHKKPTHTYPSSDNLTPAIKSHEVWIREDIPKHTTVAFFNVLDRDSGINGRVQCQITNWTEQFGLREFSGLYGVENLAELDRELIPKYYVTIQCQDHGEPMLYSHRVLIINLIDVNDQSPSFPFSVYQFRVYENSPPGTVLRPASSAYPDRIQAVDLDANSSLIYRLEPSELNRPVYNSNSSVVGVPGDSTIQRQNKYVIHDDLSNLLDYQLFFIDPQTGILTTQGELDREQKSRLNFRVCAHDGKYSTCTHVIVDLDDVNDNYPRFDRDTYVIRLEENSLPYKPIVQFSVTDVDTGNAGFTFSFVQQPEQSQPIHTSQYSQKDHLLTNSSIYNFKSNTSGLIVHEFERDQEYNQFHLIKQHFVLRENGLYLQKPLDRELQSNFHFYVQVTDAQAPLAHANNNTLLNYKDFNRNLTSQVEIFIDIADVNDNAPTFVFPNSTGKLGNRLTVSCHETIGSSVGQLQAIDPDLGANGTIRFALMQSQSEQEYLFHLDSLSGDLFVNTGLLGERCGTSVILMISADDHGPMESKIGRILPIERLIIKLEDKPTINDLLTSQTRQKWRSVPDIQNENSITEANLDNDKSLGSLSAKTILSIILGGSTIFLIGLLIVSVILLMYNRSQRRKRLMQLGRLRTMQSRDLPEEELTKFKLEERCQSLPGSAKYYQACTLRSADCEDPDTIASIHCHHQQSNLNSASLDYQHCSLEDDSVGNLSKPDKELQYTRFPKTANRTPCMRGNPSQTTLAWHSNEIELDKKYTHWITDGDDPSARIRWELETEEPTTLNNFEGKQQTKGSKKKTHKPPLEEIMPKCILGKVVNPNFNSEKGAFDLPFGYLMTPKEPRCSRIRTSPSIKPQWGNGGSRLTDSDAQIIKPAEFIPSPRFSTVPAYATVRRPDKSDSIASPIQYYPSNSGRTSYPFLTPPCTRRDKIMHRSKENTTYTDRPVSSRDEYTALVKDGCIYWVPGMQVRSSSVSASARKPKDSSYEISYLPPNLCLNSRDQVQAFVSNSHSPGLVMPCCSTNHTFLSAETNVIPKQIFKPCIPNICPHCSPSNSDQKSCCKSGCCDSRLLVDSQDSHSAHIYSPQTESRCSTKYMTVQDVLNSCV